MSMGAGGNFDRALEASLRAAGYSLTLEPPPRFVDRDTIPETKCLVYRANVEPGLSSNRSFGTFCLYRQSGSLCREYLIPEGTPTSAISLSKLTMVSAHLTVAPSKVSVCENGQLIRQRELPMPDQRPGDELERLNESIAREFKTQNECLLVISWQNPSSLAQAVRTERSLRHYGVPSDQIFRLVRSNSDQSAQALVTVEVRSLRVGGGRG